MCYVPINNNPAVATVAAVAGSGEEEQHWVPSLITEPFDFSPETASYAAQAALASKTMPPLVPSALMRRQQAGDVVVRSVWAHNLQEELELIESLLPRFRYAAVDTEFPGTVYRSKLPAYALTAEKKYALLKANVDELHLIRLGLTLFDAAGRLPGLGAGGYVWEFNFREFDVRCHRHAAESIALLRTKGVDIGRTRRDGVDAAAFGPRLRKLLRGGLGSAAVVTFSGAYDLAYLLKMMFGRGYKLPATPAGFESVVKALVRNKKLYDVKEMAGRCPSADLRGGLERVAGKLDVARAVGEAHQAGSDSLLTCQTFMKMKERYFLDDDELHRRRRGRRGHHMRRVLIDRSTHTPLL